VADGKEALPATGGEAGEPSVDISPVPPAAARPGPRDTSAQSNDTRTGKDTALADQRGQTPVDRVDQGRQARGNRPLDLLTGRGLTRAGKYLVVASESPFLERWKAVRPDYQDLVGRAKQIADVEAERALVSELDDNLILVRQQIDVINNELGALPVGGNNLVRQRRQELETARKEFDNRRAALRAEIDLRRKRIPPEPQIHQLYQDYDRQRQQFLNRTGDVRSLLDQTLKEYNALATDTAIKDALSALRQSTKSQVELGPSPDFKTAQRELSVAQRNVQTPLRKGPVAPKKGQPKKKAAPRKSL
jgi:hypothetical protein